MKNPLLCIENVSFSYKNENVINDFSICVEEGSFTTLLGASGCGKTTLLRLICGFLKPSKGKISILGEDVNKIPPNKRAVGMVFQDYALFPHLSVWKNIAYGLKIKRTKKEEIDCAVREAAQKLKITELLSRFPLELSGGQQQRVALARAIVLKPKILLMDEPLSSLDSALREKVRAELKEIQRELKITTVYVTHDQAEAFSLSDKIALLSSGKIVQEGEPSEMYFFPKNKFVATYTGQANFFLDANDENSAILIRPEWFSLSDDENAEFCGIVHSVEFLGGTTRFFVKSESNSFFAEIPTIHAEPFCEGSKIKLSAHRRVVVQK